MLRALGHLWMLPLTLIGALVALVGGVTFIEARGGALVFLAVPGGLVWRVFAATGTAGAGGFYGAFVFVADVADRRLVAHELRHAVQAMVLGPLWPVLYGLHFLWGLVTTRNAFKAYAGVFLEVDARRAAEVA